MKKKFTDKEILFLIITEDLKNLTYDELKKVSNFIFLRKREI